MTTAGPDAARERPGIAGFVRGVGRYRPLVLAVVVAAAIVAFPSDEREPAPSGTTQVGTQSSVVAPAADALGDTPGAVADTVGTVGTAPAGGSAAAPAQGGRGAAPTRAAQPGAASPAASAYPGIGSPEALANPGCDPATGRVRIPWGRVPQCVREWDDRLDNGGATSQGVTATSITVVFRLSPSSNQDADENFRRDAKATLDAVGDHLEFWGRQVKLEFHKARGDDEQSQRADAVEIANKFKPFAAMNASPVGLMPIWEAELASRGVVVFSWQAGWADIQAQPGHRYIFGMDDRLLSFQVAEWIGKRIAGRPAKWAGDIAYQGKPRTFGLVYPAAFPFDLKAFRDHLAAHGASLTDAIAYPAGVVQQQEHVRTAAARLKDRGITSVITFFDLVYGLLLTGQATSDRYYPEWVVTGFNNTDTYVISRLFDQTQWRRAFGIGPIGVPVKGISNPSPEVYRWHHGQPPRDAAVMGSIHGALWNFLFGVHLTGPNLTPKSLEAAMFSYQPNGGNWDGRVTLGNEGHSFGHHIGVPWRDYSAQDDLVEKWWDTTTTGTDEIGVTAAGVFWKTTGGKRYRAGTWPAGEPAMFVREGAVESVAAYPPADKPADYPHQPAYSGRRKAK